ncbi:MAG TPA: hypothetical protein VM262_03745 [Acidimicrobiales bacterium]|nr:hypothetical protein [Acidimicrobiales bacterium]
MKTRLLLVVLLLLTAVAACGKGDVKPASSGDPTTTTEAAEPATTTTEPAGEAAVVEVDVTATDFAYAIDGGGTFPAGEVAITLTNDGAEEHQVTVVQFREGYGFADLEPLAEDPSRLGEVLATFGGPNGVAPGDTYTATQALEPGEYLFVCFIPSPEDGEPHALKGMVAPVTVEEAEGPSEPAEADLRLALSEYEFGLGDDALLESGRYEVVNRGQQYHEVVLYAPAEGSTAQDVIDFFTSEAPPAGPPPFVPAGGTAPFDPGGRVVIDIDQGTYVAICFLPDAADGAPHFTKGMVTIITFE